MWRPFILLILTATMAMATSWNVPEEVPTIQTALDLIEDGDTIFVNPGLYVESLEAPENRNFVMIGLFDTTKGQEEWPIVDPSFLDSSRSLACLTIPATTSAVIVGMMFRNTYLMFPRGDGAIGGIANNAFELELRRCWFDSTYKSLYSSPSNERLLVEDCEFRNGVATRIRESSSAISHINGCRFIGSHSAVHLFLDGHVTVEQCRFSSNISSCIAMGGLGMIIRDCLFGTEPGFASSAIWGIELAGSLIEHNVFQDFTLTEAAVFIVAATGEPNRIQYNSFLHNYSTSPGYAGGIKFHGNGETAEICNNSFVDCDGQSSYSARNIYLENTTAVVSYNSFVGFDNYIPCVFVNDGAQSARIHHQSFDSTGWALSKAFSSWVDADSCWWGDSTGPYHATLNPQGMGATVTGNVDFEPWLTDSSQLFEDSTEYAFEPPELLPSEFGLTVFPNPFNATTTLTLAVREPGFYRVDLYNTLGRYVKELWSGPVSQTQSISFEAQSLASGIYIARARRANGIQTVGLTKIVLLK